MNPLTQFIREMYPKTHITPISVMWSIRQAVMGDHVPLENPTFTNKSNIHDSRRTKEETAKFPQ